MDFNPSGLWWMGYCSLGLWIHSHTQQIFIENLLWARQCPRHSWESSEQKGHRSLSLESINHGCCSLLSHIQLFETPWTAACQAPLSSTISQSLFKLMYMYMYIYIYISSSGWCTTSKINKWHLPFLRLTSAQEENKKAGNGTECGGEEGAVRP